MPRNPFDSRIGNLPENLIRATSLNRYTIYFLTFVVLFAAVFPQFAQGQIPVKKEFPVGALKRIDQLPDGRFRGQLDKLPPAAQNRALEWLRSFHFPESDVTSLHVDAAGGISYTCEFGHAHVEEEPATEETEPETANAAVPISPFPDSLKFHSRPGLTKRIYINFVGETVSGTAWNDSLGRTSIPALAYSTDTDSTTFSDAEQAAIKRIWQRMAEDFAAFDIDVTTERPATFNTTTAMVLITRNTDANGNPNPASTAGGVAYVNVFGISNFSFYSPAWVYHNNLGNGEANIAEAASHEIGHNLGLSHDGTSSQSYYGGHGTSSDPISWGPLMGTGYNRNVSQWSKGDYLNANNTQDDLAIIAGKTGYRTDDHGNSPGAATPLTITGGTTISSTTPQNDPTNSNPANKGVIERTTDTDVFSFVTGAGSIQLNANPWIQSAGTRGGNLDILLELRDETGSLLASSNPADLTTASITANVSAGAYYLHVRNTGVGDPFASTPTGYTVYGSGGQYFISGTVKDPGGFVVAPVAEGQFSDLTGSGQSTHTFSVTYSDDVAVDVSSLGTGDVRVTGPNDYNQLAQFVSVDNTTNGSPRTAIYSVTPAGGGTWTASLNGTYTVSIELNQIQDTQGQFVPSGQLGGFQVGISVPLYSANMSTNPGWTLGTHWTYAKPNYGSGPNAGFTGDNVIGHSMSGSYPKGINPATYATSPLITNAAGASFLTLRFQRWLGLKKDDIASLEVTGDNGATWVTLWSSSADIGDSGWQLVQYNLPPREGGYPELRFRWGLRSITGKGNSPTAIGWHIDDVELLGGGTLDASPPAAVLSVADITDDGSPTHPCAVTYTDETAVLLSSIDVTDLRVIGPAGELAPLLVQSVGADRTENGSPLTGTYTIAAPGGSWDALDNGTYTITLQEGAVEDTLGNTIPGTVLGSFTVNISTLMPGVLTVTPLVELVSSGNFGGPFSPVSVEYLLSNTGATDIAWTAEKTANWVSLSSSGGTLGAGASTFVTVSINSNANALSAGVVTDTVNFANITNNNGNTTRDIELTVNNIPVTVTHGDLTPTYDGTAKPVSVTTDPTPVSFTVTYDGLADVPVNAGEYAVLTTVTETGYEGSVSDTLVIAKASQTIDFAALGSVPYDQDPFVLTATASSNLTVSYQSSNTAVATVSGTLVTVTGAGETTITASQLGDMNHLAATSVPRTLIVLTAYENWADGSFANPLLETGSGDDPDGDGLANLLEFAFGTDPTVSSPGPLTFSEGVVTSPGQPVLTKESGIFQAVFARRRNHEAQGLTYTVQFSTDLSPEWIVSETAPSVIATGTEIDAVKVPFPTMIPTPNGSAEPHFFRIGVSQAP